MNPTQGGWLILLSLVVALLLAVVHLPESWPQWLGWLRPAWVIMVLFFWVMELPPRVGLVSAWLSPALPPIWRPRRRSHGSSACGISVGS